MGERVSINIGLIGLGVIGGGVARILSEKSDFITRQVGIPLVLKRVADLIESRKESLADPSIFTTDARSILEDPDIDIVIELIGGETPAKNFIDEALRRGKHVVTANKEVLAKHGPELRTLARAQGWIIL